MKDQVYRNEYGTYILCATRPQIDRIADLNQRWNENLTLADHLEGVEIVEENDPRVDMITGRWGPTTIGILPDGSAHS